MVGITPPSSTKSVQCINDHGGQPQFQRQGILHTKKGIYFLVMRHVKVSGDHTLKLSHADIEADKQTDPRVRLLTRMFEGSNCTSEQDPVKLEASNISGNRQPPIWALWFIQIFIVQTARIEIHKYNLTYAYIYTHTLVYST